MHPQDGRVVSNFIMQALRGEDINVYGEGQQTRSFCFCDELVDGFIRFMNNTEDSFLGPMNLGNPAEFTILELAKLIIELTGSKSKIIHQDLPKDDPTQRQPDITLAKEKIGWDPKITLREDLVKTIKYLAKLIENEK